MNRRRFLSIAAAGATLPTVAWSVESEKSRGMGEATVDQAIDWLIAHQSADGAWRSRTYSELRSGIGTTALAALALVRSWKATEPKVVSALGKGVQFLKDQFSRDDSLGVGADYPTYVAAMLIMVLIELESTSERELRERLVTQLIDRQRIGRHGYLPGDADFGGWAPGLEVKADPSAAAANISITSHVLQALRAADAITPEMRTSAETYLRRLQYNDPQSKLVGGFTYTAAFDSPLNKAGFDVATNGKRHALPYHSATCDGLLALAACDPHRQDNSFRLATSALAAMPLPRLSRAPVDVGQIDRVQGGLFFYAAAALSRLPSLTTTGHARLTVWHSLRRSQQVDGCWRNPLPWMREDDPLVATSFAIEAMSALSRPK
ncbi:prenyltransferase/squalene oxidase repeat-containing protein [Blastopirellula retiformator]|uniref:Prenyltransferase and squalene oxidase repeat protein n=1 Tax=Blastopirellula retiformator TaxID=2527970 RepID=A0A5C5V6Y0_9BACT|nr:hypothetical protein [Blastopirellula retiformator]TWT34328.1 hypothetical protein Enr8_17220 [Blastopirellula retiformator]